MKDTRRFDFLDSNDFKYIGLPVSHYLNVVAFNAISLAEFIDILYECNGELISVDFEVSINTDAINSTRKRVYGNILRIRHRSSVLDVRIAVFNNFTCECNIKCLMCKYEKRYNTSKGLSQFISFHECK